MTLKDVWKYTLIELNKENVESILLEAFNYFLWKAEIQYGNIWYNLYNLNQQTDDNLRMLKRHTIIPLVKSTVYGNSTSGIYSNIYESLINDTNYFHILGCVVEYDVTPGLFNNCDNNTVLQYKARRLTPDIWGSINVNHYFRPKYQNPYFYLHDVEDSGIAAVIGLETNEVRRISDLTSGLQLEVLQATTPKDLRIEIRTGKLPDGLNPSKIYVEYLKHPKVKVLTQEDLDLVVDTTESLEYPDYVCFEIIKELVKLFLENTSNPRLQTNMPINQTVMSPVQTNTK